MLFVGNQRGGATDLAQHLMKDDNERVEIHEVRGFASKDLASAFRESYAISRATKCKQHLFSLSVNAPPIEDALDDDFIDAINRAERCLGLDGQPRAIVFHEKEGRDGQLRRHAHAVWSRIDAEEMKAKQMSFSKTKLMELSRELYLEKDWRMPPGMLHKPDRDPRKFTLEQWQQAKRAKKDPEKIIGIFQDCWSVSDSAASFGHALQEHGYILAQGRRGFVGVDHNGEVYAVSKWTKKRAKDVREKLGDHKSLQSVDQAHAQAAQIVTARLQELQAEQAREEAARQEHLRAERERQEAEARAQRQRQLEEQRQRRQAEALERAERLRKGLLGFLDRLTGRRKETLLKNQEDMALAFQRDKAQREERHRQETSAREIAHQKQLSLKAQYERVQVELSQDIKTLAPSQDTEKERHIQAVQTRLARNRQRNRSQNRSRDGPSLER
ncbi:MAG: relaxase [Paracoccaceae bacterium]|nr:relaxase [Paracoccaceae bacterium]